MRINFDGALAMAEPFLEIQNLKTHFPVERGIVFRRRVGTVRAVDGVTLSLKQGEIWGLVGESGCGKSTLGRTILQLIPPTEGTVILAGRNLTQLRGEQLRAARADFQMIFQDPYASLNPRMTIFDALAEAIRSHKRVPKSELPARVSELMKKVGLSPRFLKKYPHEFSGGQRQRIAVARALAVEPQLMIADEPVSALDVLDPGADHQPARPAFARNASDAGFHFARSLRREAHCGPDRGHVSRQDRRDRSGDARVRAAVASVHQGACQRRADSRPCAREATSTHYLGRSTTIAHQPAERLSVPSAVPLRNRRLRAHRAPA